MATRRREERAPTAAEVAGRAGAGGRRRDNKAGDDESSERDLRSLLCSALTSPVFSHLLKAAREASNKNKDMLEFENIFSDQRDKTVTVTSELRPNS